MDKFNLEEKRRECALRMLRLYNDVHAGHIGSSLSCLELLVDLCFGRMAAEDELVLSKGHAAGALYTVLSLSGRMPEAPLESFYKNGTKLGGHPPCSRAIKSIPFGTGSLGHGLSLAAGIAFSQRFTGRKFSVYAILSDGDCNEGSTWEAAIFAAQKRLSSLTVLVDYNRIQGFGFASDIASLEPMAEKWRSFGFEVATAKDGNSFQCLDDAFRSLPNSDRPRCIVAHTVKGHGVSYMENKVEWHYLPMSAEQYGQAIEETNKLSS